MNGPPVMIFAISRPGEIMAAAVSKGTLIDLAISRPGAPDGVGDLYTARVTARVPAMAGAFLALAGAPDGFLPDSEGAAGLTEGQRIGVRVTRAAQAGKGPRLTAKLAPEEHARVAAGSQGLVARGPGAIERLARLYPEAPIVADDPALTAGLVQSLAGRIGLATEPIDGNVLDQIDNLGQPDVTLPGGGRLRIHPTPALVAIDVDAGVTTAARQSKTSAQTAFNRAMFGPLARQIRLRNLSGAIVIDLAGLSPRRRAALGPDLALALTGDPIGPRFLGFSALGLAEILRPRIHPPLHELLSGPHAAELAALREVARVVAAEPGRMPVLRAESSVAAALGADSVALSDLARRCGRPLVVRSDPRLPPCRWILEPPENEQADRSPVPDLRQTAD